MLAVLGDQLDALDAVEAGVEADAFVDVVGVGRVVGAGDLQRNDLVLELAGLGRGNRALVALIGIGVELVLGEPYFSAIISAPVNWLNSCSRIASRCRALERAVPKPFLRAARSGAHRHARHDLHAGGDHDVQRAGHHRLRREMQRLLRRAALAVDRGRGHALGSFEAITALRAMLLDCSPACITQPMITSSIWAGSTAAIDQASARKRRDRPDASLRDVPPCGQRCVRRRRYRPRP